MSAVMHPGSREAAYEPVAERDVATGAGDERPPQAPRPAIVAAQTIETYGPTSHLSEDLLLQGYGLGRPRSLGELR